MKIAEAEEILRGVTSGPWTHDGEPWNLIVWDGNGNRVCFMAHSNGLDDARDVATARFIAWCREGVPVLLARIAAQEAQIKGLAMDVVSAGCQAQEAYEAQKAAEAERDALATEKFKMRDERDKAKIAASNYAEFSHTWRARAEAAETALAASESRVANLVEALDAFPADWRERAHSFKGVLKLQAAWADGFNAARAAITEATQ